MLYLCVVCYLVGCGELYEVVVYVVVGGWFDLGVDLIEEVGVFCFVVIEGVVCLCLMLE